jgi:DNA mismatch repair protein MutL
LVNNEFEVYNLRIGNLKQRMVAMMGDQYQSLTVPVEERSDHIQVYGFVGKPELAKKTRGEQWLFVNKRFIRSNYLHHAVMQAYADMLPKETFPFYMLFIDINPNLIDINVHPTKQEIKFEDDRLVYTFVNAGIRHSLARFSVTPTLDFTQEGAINNWEAFLTMPAKNDDEKKVVNPVKSPSPWSMHHSAVKKNTQQCDWEELYKAALDKPEETMTVASGTHESLIPQQEGEMHRTKAPYQIHQRYIIMPIRSGFVVIDQQAAHERVLYEKYLMSFQKNKISGQRQLFQQRQTLLRIRTRQKQQ